MRIKFDYHNIHTVCLLIFLVANAIPSSGQAIYTQATTNEKIKEQNSNEKLRIGIVGLVHAHVHWILGREDRADIEIVGIVESNRDLAKRYSLQHGFSMDIVYDNLEEMLDKTKPEAVTAFNTIYGHLEVVKYCAPRGIHVMVEKPLAVSLEHANQMIALAKNHKIHLLTNYETSWYGSTEKAYELVHSDKKIGDIRKIVFNTGHPGPIEIGCNVEFLEWLTDPVLNGGGALTDFGCYGANLATWLMKGQTPLSVSCVTQQIKPDKYPKVEDEATIVLTYPKAQVIIQASWNWSHNRKDMSIYGEHGFVVCHDGKHMNLQESEEKGMQALVAPDLSEAINDPFAYLYQIIKNDMKVESFCPSSLENNLVVMQILEAAKISAQQNRTLQWDEFLLMVK